ncbi:maleylpyruvate isomerase family mycothiol-dependent enzyme [Amycolatopsis sp. La24]|uniref:maleylpyruvate isomerase family mycothiol-dependent enzyme n=1 Tax=Amycolatopsis sp. La24 TaxID=3028304 RepID=UPI0023AF4260|nr:maleylpyruvate isomerase family mycothiol-dependent enzyme [Amycolatopsis sp. La24]
MLDYGLDLSEITREAALPDLLAEGDDLDAVVSAEPDWSRPTPAEGWTIAHQIAHLAAADANVVLAIRTPEKFAAVLGENADAVAAEGAARPRAELLDHWRAGRAEVAAALGEIPLDQAFPWYGSQSTSTLAVALRLMETWAHGQDIFDTVRVEHRPTDRLKHIAALGVAGRGLSFYAAQLPLPTEPIRVELTSPEGVLWGWGPDDAAQRIRGSARDFCLRITQRRGLDETGLAAIGKDAKAWLENARVFL